MSDKNDLLDQALRIDELGDGQSLDGVAVKSRGRIKQDDLDENSAMLDEVESGLRLADDEFEGVSVGLLGGDIDPDLVQFDADGNVVRKRPGEEKKKKSEDEFADDEDLSIRDGEDII